MDQNPPPPPGSNNSSPGDDAADDFGWDIPGVERDEACESLEPLDSELAFLKQFAAGVENLFSSFTDRIFEGLSDGGLVAAVRILQQASNIADSRNIAATHQVAVREKYGNPITERMGAKDETRLLEDLTGLGRVEVKQRQLLASRVISHKLGNLEAAADYGHVEQALATGSLSAAGALQITRTLEKAEVTNPEMLENAELGMIQAATGRDIETGQEVSFPLSVEPMRRVCKHWEMYLCPDGTMPVEEVAEAKRFLNIGGKTAYGLVRIQGALLGQDAALLTRLFDAINNPAANSEDMVDSDGKQVSDERTAAQKRHDAFAMILDAAAKSQDIPKLGGAAVTVLIKTSLEDLFDTKGVAWLLDHNGQFAPAHSAAARHALCVGTTHTYLQSTSGQVEALSSPNRVFTANQRKAILVRDGGCVIPGCTVPATWCEIHHVTPYHQGGPTRVENGVALCWHHHRTLGATGWEIRIKAGDIQVKPPPGYAQEWYLRQKLPKVHDLEDTG